MGTIPIIKNNIDALLDSLSQLSREDKKVTTEPTIIETKMMI
jgi:hypothetical protein